MSKALKKHPPIRARSRLVVKNNKVTGGGSEKKENKRELTLRRQCTARAIVTSEKIPWESCMDTRDGVKEKGKIVVLRETIDRRDRKESGGDLQSRCSFADHKHYKSAVNDNGRHKIKTKQKRLKSRS